jgi:endonuclease YncB( thermonuclease family)
VDDAKNQRKIRFSGIDAPEKGQPFGERSKQRLSALVFQKRIEARCHGFGATLHRHDRQPLRER